MMRGGDSDEGTHHHQHSTPNHWCEQLLMGWKEGAMGGDDNEGEGSTMTTQRHHHSTPNHCHEQLLVGWIVSANGIDDQHRRGPTLGMRGQQRQGDDNEDDNETTTKGQQ